MAFQRHGRTWTSSLLSSLAKLIPWASSLDKASLLRLEGLGRKRSSERDHLEGPVLGILQLGVRIWHTFSEKVEMERDSSVKYSLHTGRVRSAKWETLGQSFESSMGGAWIACSLGVLPWGNTAFLRFSVNLHNRNVATYPSGKNQRMWRLWSV